MEKNELIRKGTVTGIIILFVGASIVPSMSGDINRSNSISSSYREGIFGIAGVDNYYNDVKINSECSQRSWSPGPLLSSEPYSAIGQGWVRIDLSTPVALDINKDMWISIEITHAADDYPFTMDAGPAVDGKGDWVCIEGEWFELQYYSSSFDFNIAIEAIISNDGSENSIYYYDPDTLSGAFGLVDGGTFEAAIRLTPDELSGYEGWVLIAARFYHYSTSTHFGNLKIYDAGGEPPVASFTWTPTYPNPDEQITFDASASYDPDGTIDLYEWDFDNDEQYDDATGISPTWQWSSEGDYPVSLKVTDNDGGHGYKTKTVSVV